MSFPLRQGPVHRDAQGLDEEKIPHPSAAGVTDEEGGNTVIDHQGAERLPVLPQLRDIHNHIENLAGFEARGVARVLPEERQPPSWSSDVQVAIMCYSANISPNNLAAAMLGPLAFHLGFLDCVMCAVFGALVGSLTTAYMSIWRPQSGN
ncbi:uncharacterized protein MAM_01251 [Metarhizium album ARSEF 1941]|uniref:Uncharacterized protein n=1 Tax=Metarhizium album (strain ARSEF 1941) TaxID=1081103 RepID=A0A0B2X3Z2_METAS|nr:uncharacterized protein MAM_01251 [Metarhizium album ARSEF 1941]KHO00473.1 hypothetical protein MAM_01251 [Metarhizium album ARSEF 1941]